MKIYTLAAAALLGLASGLSLTTDSSGKPERPSYEDIMTGCESLAGDATSFDVTAASDLAEDCAEKLGVPFSADAFSSIYTDAAGRQGGSLSRDDALLFIRMYINPE